MAQVDRILVEVPDPARGSRALDRAVEEARLRGSELHLVAHVPPPRDDDAARGYQNERKVRAEALERLASRLAGAHGLACRAHVPAGVDRRSAAILDVAAEERVDLIVIPVRRRSRVGKLVLGSTAQDVLLGADCPVLTVKTGAEPSTHTDPEA